MSRNGVSRPEAAALATELKPVIPTFAGIAGLPLTIVTNKPPVLTAVRQARMGDGEQLIVRPILL
jgi:hypothetical protein